MKKTILLGTSIIVLIAAGVIIIKMMFPADRLKALVTDAIGRHMNREIVVADVSLQIFPTIGIALDNLEVSDRPDLGDDRPFITLERFLLDLEIMPLLDRRLVVEELAFSRPQIRVIYDENGIPNFNDLIVSDTTAVLQESQDSEEASDPLSIQISAIVIDNGVVTYIDRQTETTIHLNGLSNIMSLDVEPSVGQTRSAGDLSVQTIQMVSSGSSLDDIGVSIRYNLLIDEKADVITLEETDLALQDVNLILTGMLSGYQGDSTDYRLTFKSDNLSLEDVLTSIPPSLLENSSGLLAQGDLTIEGVVQGNTSQESQPEITADVQIDNGQIEIPDLPVPVTGLNGRMNLDDDRLTISSLKGQLGRSDVAITGDAGPIIGGSANQKLQANVSISSENIDLDELSPPVPEGVEPVPFEPLPDMILTGEVSAGKVVTRALTLSDLQMDVSMKDQVIRLSDIQANTYGGKLSGTITQDLTDLNQPGLTLDTKFDEVNVGSLLSSYLPIDNLLSGTISSSITLNALLDPTGIPIENALDALGSLSIREGRVANWSPVRKMSSFLKIPDVESIDFRTLTGGFTVEGGRIITPNLKLVGPRGDWTASGSAGLDGTLSYGMKVVLPPDLTQKAGNGLADQALSYFKDDKGQANLEFSIGGTVSDPEFKWEAKKQVTSRLQQEGQSLLQEKKQELLDETGLSTTNVDSLKGLARDLVTSKADSTRKEVTDNVKDKAKGLLRGLLKKNN